MEIKEFSELTDEELLVEKKKLKKSRIFHALSIGFLAGILIFGTVSWVLSPDKRIGFFIPMMILVFLIYRVIKSPNKNATLERVLKERGLN